MNVDHQMLEAAHKHSIYNQTEIKESDICGCFYCLKTFLPTEIEEWTDEDSENQTAMCPYCGIDSVIGNKSGYPVTDNNFIKHMQYRWF